MKILILKTFPLSLKVWDEVGILERESNLYKKIISKTNYKFSIFSFGGKNDEKYQNIIFPIKIFTTNTIFKNSFIYLIYSFFIPFIFKKPFKKCDIIQTNQFWGSWIGIIASKLYNKKLILREGFQFYQFQTKLNKKKKIRLFILEKISRYIYRNSNKIIVTSNKHKDYLIKKFNLDNYKIFVIPNFIDTSIFKKIDINKSKKLLFVGRLNFQKNLELIIKAISNSNLECDIIGYGDREKYIALKNKYNSKVNFINNVKNNDLVEFYNKCSIFLLCSHFEGNPKTLLEAMSCECSIICSNSEGIIEIVDSECAVIVDNDSNNLRRQIFNLLNDINKRKKMGKNARNKILKNNDLNIICNKFIETYSIVLDEN